MPKGTPLWPKCPKCRRGAYGAARVDRGVFKTGRVETKISRSNHKGYGHGGRGFRGHRGELECRDCGYRWFSTHPVSGRIRCYGEACTHVEVA